MGTLTQKSAQNLETVLLSAEEGGGQDEPEKMALLGDHHLRDRGRCMLLSSLAFLEHSATT